MIEHTPAAAAVTLVPLHDVTLNHGFARAVTEGVVDGRLWTDRTGDVQAAHALHPYGMSLVWGPHLGRAIEPLARHLRGGQYRRGSTNGCRSIRVRCTSTGTAGSTRYRAIPTSHRLGHGCNATRASTSVLMRQLSCNATRWPPHRERGSLGR